MESVKRILIILAFLSTIVVGTFYLYPLSSGLASLFSMACLGGGCACLARKKNRNATGWFFLGLFGGIAGLAMVIAVKPLERPEFKEPVQPLR